VKKYLAVLFGFVIIGIVLVTAFTIPTRRIVQAVQPTLQPTETARALTTPTTLPPSTPRPLTSPDWSDVSVHRKAMKPGFESDVESFVNANRYLIEATLTFEPDAVVRGAALVRYTNRTGESLSVIVFRLYPNTPALGGRLNITSVLVNGEPLEPSFSELRSVMGIPLPIPLEPDQAVEIKLDFNLVMSRGLNTSYGRFGYEQEVVSATAWYPTLSVYDPGEGWWMDMPSPQGDPAYTESGLYDVRLTVPANLTVAMSGTIIERRENGDNTVTYRDVTGPMRDHAFQASSRYAIKTQEVEGTKVNVVYYQDRAADPVNGTEVALQYAVNSVKTFNAAFGEYPFLELDVVQNPTPSGVEFPGLVQISQKAWVRGNDYLEVVIAHEIGHQWFYSLIGNNQVRHPWLDESLTSYTEFVYMRAIYPQGTKAQDYVSGVERFYTSYTGSGQPDQPLDLPVKNYFNYAYGAIIYRKGPLFYVELERILGRETVTQALQEYFRRYRYEVVQSADVKRVFEEVSGKDLGEVFRKWVEG